jgi:peptide-methionine (S)-S-oxide reductase
MMNNFGCRALIRFAVVIALVVITASVSNAAERTAIFAGGCFWGVEAVYEHVKGVKDVKTGYAGGTKQTAKYSLVSAGETDHAESVRIVFDDTMVTYEQLLYIFFAVVHDSTEVDRQGPDVGRQYRSAVFYMDEKQKNSAEAFVRSIDLSKVFNKPVATKLEKFTAFYEAEAEHQDLVRREPKNEYVVAHDLPKLAALKQKFPLLWVDKYRLGTRR